LAINVLKNPQSNYFISFSINNYLLLILSDISCLDSFNEFHLI